MSKARLDWHQREGHPLMREPEECIQCRRWHVPTEPCRKTAYCVNCGRVVGIFAADAAEDRECIFCIRERLS